MNRVQRLRIASLAGLLAMTPAALAQARPYIGMVYPAGGQQGTTVQVAVGGQYLVEVTDAYVSGDGVQAVVLPSEPIIGGKEAAGLRERLHKLREMKQDALVREEIRAIRHKLAVFEKSRVTPAIGQTINVRINIARNATPGNRELRLGTATGLTNPLIFQIGQLPEFREPAPARDDDWVRIQESVNDARLRAKPDRASRPPWAVTLPATINGQLLPGEVDRFQFKARRGQKMVVAASARELLPYIADAVPGWLQLSVALFDAQGKELSSADDVQIRADPVLRYEIPADGEYVLEIKDSLYRGREDFVYRVRVGELPFPAAVFPLRPAAAENLPEVFATATNTQAVTLPVIINGRISKRGEAAVFQFEGRAGQHVVAEVVARRLGSPLDSVLTLTDAAGNRLAFNDDHEDPGSGLLTHHADSYLSCTLPTDGKYFVRITDAQRKGGPDYGYRLRISSPQPDFALRVVPSTINIRANATRPLTVYVLRRDGFSGEIELALKDAPAGFRLDGGRIPANQNKVQCTLTAPATPSKTPITLKLEGRATIQGKAVVHPAVPAQDMTQAFNYRHLVPSDDFVVGVNGRFAPDSSAKILSTTPVKIPLQGAARVLFNTPRYTSYDVAQLQLADPPEGITLKGTSSLQDGIEVVIAADPAKVKPGLKGNLIVAFVAKDTTPPGAPKINPKRVPLGTLPAIPYEVVESAGPGRAAAEKAIPSTAPDKPSKTEPAEPVRRQKSGPRHAPISGSAGVKPNQPEPPAGFDVARAGIARGKIETVEYNAKQDAGKYRVSIYTPPGFSPQTKYPVLYLLHGASGDESDWTRTLHADAILDNLHADKKLVPMIVVMPSCLSVAARAQAGDSRDAKARAAMKFGKVLLNDLLPFVESKYPVFSDREHRALAGYSMGASVAFATALLNPDKFAWIGA
ncbi:MAG: alpha/beta hydrolase-fold protein, partial [Verrucomicrobiae bacterium]|nr:alpha/beta hydrolase-fold protein [Verrucomicrobiae bacterium]